MKKSVIFSILILLGGAIMLQSQTQLPDRTKIQDKYKWNLTDIFTDENSWNKEYTSFSQDLHKFSNYKGKISMSAKSLLELTDLMMAMDQRFGRLSIYSSLGKDIDLTNQGFQILSDKTQKLGAEYSSAISFYNPEVLMISDSQMEKFYKEEPGLRKYKHKFDVIFRTRKNTLSADQEKLLAELSPIFAIPSNTYNVLNDAELPFPLIKDEKGNDVQVSHGRYRAGLYNQNRQYRHDVYMGNYVPYKQLKGTMAAIYNGRVKERVILAKIRNYNSTVESALYDNNIPVSVYDNLIKVTNANLKTQHRWASIKKRILKLNEIHPYDTYVSLFPSVNKSYNYDEAVEICKKALAPLGKEYVDAMTIGFENRWIDVYETKAKRSGAYSNSSGCGPHPFILLNWNNTLDDMFTLVHELGHNMHSFFTEKTQPYHYRDYSTFVAEVASTANESLLLDYLVKNAKSKEEKMALIEKFLTNIQMTFFRQTHFAEFERMTHERAEKGEYLTDDQLTEEFAKMYQKYWGPEMKTDYEEGLSWSRIPHLFKYNFYVYQYATSFAASFALVENIKNNGQPSIDKYLKFLSSGSYDYPIEILKNAGIDMTDESAIQAVINKANEYLDELENMLK